MITKKIKAINKRVSSIWKECEMFSLYLALIKTKYNAVRSGGQSGVIEWVLETFQPSVHSPFVFYGDGKVKNSQLNKIPNL